MCAVAGLKNSSCCLSKRRRSMSGASQPFRQTGVAWPSCPVVGKALWVCDWLHRLPGADREPMAVEQSNLDRLYLQSSHRFFAHLY
jgi:hypothetical protein